jgi:hypothetical protein
MLGVLTNKLYLLSKPVTPDFCKALLLNATAKIVQKMENGKLFARCFLASPTSWLFGGGGRASFMAAQSDDCFMARATEGDSPTSQSTAGATP